MSRWKLALIVVVLLVVGLVGWRIFHSAAAPAAAGRRGAAGNADAPVPVTVVAAANRDVPVYLTALGTVQALNTVTVNAQVGGQLVALHFAEGQEVKQGDLLAEIDPRTYQAALDQAVAKKKQDAAQLSASQSTLARYEELIKKNFVSAQDLENQRQTVRQQQALIAADEAAIASARTQLGYTRITAPITGIAGIRQVDVGNIVQANAGSGIVVLTQVHPVNVMFTLPEQNLESVRSAQAAAAAGLEVAALDRTDAHVIATGALKVIDNQIDTTTGTFKLKSEFANADAALWPGQFVNVRVKLRTVAGGLVVPATAVQRGPEGNYVYALQADGTVAMKPVTTAGDAGDDAVLVASGIAAGDKVVTEGQFRLKPGSKVQALAPGETPAPPSAQELSKLKDSGAPQQRRGGRRGGG
ncbi:efflux RND transporter periplasmic adaptor subunit [Dokdonella fugitiva]|uniref:efflux RND transporter periplasmic adaptor subunit n=1 Tax=Dokdonella fugitiva TaxID=328517 RepID=UPI0015FE36FE|nr:efflux RND transporter periplasmic adaptor subunit [Dokdonella fugitiva]MBA8882807.1 multidrug efflux system membrane fusion protein [Dokdonella fugitiva]